MNTQEILKALNWRYAVKKFDSKKKLSQDQWSFLEESLILSPSSYGLQPYQFLIVQNSELRKKLTPLSWGQTQIEDCSHLVVFTTLKKVTEDYVNKFISLTATTRNIDAAPLAGYKDMMIGDLVKGPRAAVIQDWAQRQAYIAMGNIMNAAALIGVDTCPLEGLKPAGYDEVLGLKNSEYATVAAVACGFRDTEDKYQHAKKVRFSKEQLIKVV
jgi:nitroreductase